MTTVTNSRGDILHRSRNLRAMLDHARRAVPVAATFGPSVHGGTILTVEFDNGDWAHSPYESPVVAGRFLNSRRSWPRLRVDGPAAFVAEYESGRRL